MKVEAPNRDDNTIHKKRGRKKNVAAVIGDGQLRKKVGNFEQSQMIEWKKNVKNI